MGDINSIVGVVRILEPPRQTKTLNNILLTELRVQVPQSQKTQRNIISLVVWGNLVQDIIKYYKVNDYILIEGYLSIRNGKKQNISFKRKKIQITVLKIYPLVLNYNNLKFSLAT